jgi:hypothetical protein
MALREDLLPVVDAARAIAGDLGFRRFQVWARVTTYGGSRVGEGVKTVTDTRLLVGGQNPKVRELRSKDLSAGTTEHTASVYEIGPLTPEFAGGGIAESVTRPEKTSTPTTILFLIKGPGLPENGLLCQRFDEDVDRPLRMTIRVKSSGVKQP